jgi:hypothetical protein
MRACMRLHCTRHLHDSQFKPRLLYKLIKIVTPISGSITHVKVHSISNFGPIQ